MNSPADRPVADLRKNLRAPLIIQKVHIDGARPAFFGYSKNISKSVKTRLFNGDNPSFFRIVF